MSSFASPPRNPVDRNRLRSAIATVPVCAYISGRNATRRTAMLSRRALVMAAGSLALAVSPARAAAVMTDDGYYREDWFLDSFLDLADDLKSTAAAGKQLVVIWEQQGCPYCRDTHLINFAQKDIETYIRDHFEV